MAAVVTGCATKTPAGDGPHVTTTKAKPKEHKPDAKAWAHQYVTDMVQVVESNKGLEAVNKSEGLHRAVRASVLKPWEDAWLAKRGEAFGKLLAKDASGPAWASSKTEAARESEGIREQAWKLTSAKDSGDQATKYLADFKKVDDFRLVATKVVATEKGAAIELDFDLRGELASGARRHDRGSMTLHAERAGEDWKIRSIETRNMQRLETIQGRKPAFEHATAKTGLGKVPRVDRREAIRRGGYAIAVSDFDNDGRDDVLLGHYGAVQLYRNTGKGFEDVTEASGIQKEALVKAAAFVDLDQDGHRDLILLRFLIHGNDAIGDFVAYRNQGNGKFELKKDVLPKTRTYDAAMPLTLADFDGNGTVDIYVGFPGSRDFSNNLDRGERKEGLHSQGIWYNDGNWKFRESSADSTLVAARSVYPHSAVASDIDQDGKIDVIVVDDSGRVNPVYKNNGDGKFTDVTNKMGLAAPGWSMGLSTGDFDGDGDLDIVTTNVALTAGRRISASVQGKVDEKSKTGELLTSLQAKYVGALLYKNDGDGKFTDVADEAGISAVGDGAGGAEWIDYNGDGHLDLYVPNGLWTGGPENFDSMFIRAISAFPKKYGVASDVIRGSVFAAPKVDPNPMLTALRNYNGQLGKTTPGEGKPALSLGGNQRNRLYRNNGNGTFTEVGYLEGADRIEDGYVVSTFDYNSDGRQDLVLRNTDPAPGLSYEPVTVLLNTLEGANTLSVRASSAKNIDGIGAIVTAHVGKRKLVREIRATNGATQSAPVAFFGLGKAEKVDRVDVRWPSGKVEQFGAQKAGNVVLKEGAGKKAK